MGEAKQEEAKVEAQPEEQKVEEKKKENQVEEKKEETQEKKEADEPSPPPPPPPIVLHVDLHCVGCAKKIERAIFSCKGVENVEMDMAQNQVTVKGVVDPQALSLRVQRKTMRDVKVLSPSPEESQVGGITTTELHVNMHCEACAQQLQKKILKMRGVQAVQTDLSSGTVTVTGTMKPERVVDYVYRRTRKFAKIVPQPPKEEKKDEAKKVEEKPAEDKKEETKPEEAMKEEEKKEENKPEEKPADETSREEPKKEDGGPPTTAEDDTLKRMVYWPPVYGVERLRLPPPPQLFSDENPNACCIS